ncbi:MAG: hypothetical protein K2I62_03125 [Alistipes sp.]|nr:hypothetical protein [Alistipes sp.]
MKGSKAGRSQRWRDTKCEPPHPGAAACPGPKDRTIDTKQSLLRPQRITPKNNPDFCLQYPAECLFVGKIFSIFAVLTAFARSDIFESVFALSLTENVAVFKVAGQRTALFFLFRLCGGRFCALCPISIQVWGIASFIVT